MIAASLRKTPRPRWQRERRRPLRSASGRGRKWHGAAGFRRAGGRNPAAALNRPCTTWRGTGRHDHRGLADGALEFR